MPLASTVRVTPHFTAGELGADQPGATGTVLANLAETARRMETVRDVLQSRIRVTSGYRPASENELAGGVPTSDHITGLALDGVPLDTTQFLAHQRLREAASTGRLPPWDQIIFYPVQGHIHFGFGARTRREFRIRMYEGTGGTPLLSPELVSRLRGAL